MSTKDIIYLMASLFVVGVIVGWIRPKRTHVSTMIVGSGFPLLVTLRIAMDIAHNPLSHNLLPLEIMLACMLSLSSVFLGSQLGAHVRGRLQAQRDN